jgi:hypothetical protein
MKKKESNSIMDMFNLPSYTKGKTFAEASKLIAKKFEGRTDKESVDTLQDLQGRLQQAQEYIKKQSQPTEQPQPQGPAMGPTNDHFLGGIMSILGGAGGAAGLLGGAASSAIPGLGALAKAPEAISHFKEGNAAKGIMSAASGAASMIPGVGAIASPILDIAGSFIGNGAAEKKALDMEVNNTATQARQYNNKYFGGGFMNNIDPNELIKMIQTLQIPQMTGTSADYHTPGVNPYSAGVNAQANSNDAKFKAMGLDDASLDEQAIIEQIQENNQIGDWLKQQQQQQQQQEEEEEEEDEEDEEGEGEDLQSKYDPSTLLRYAPAVTDAYQLATLKKPDEVSRGRLGNKYQSQQVDERSLVQGVQEGISSNRDAILGSSGGSGAAARANLLGLSLQGTKALSSAMQSAGEANRQDNRTGQQFNLGVDQTNLQQSNAEKLANEQNQGAYDIQKSQLISQLGSNLGEIGKEQLFKKYPELMGMDFDATGKYINGKKKKKKTR